MVVTLADVCLGLCCPPFCCLPVSYLHNLAVLEDLPLIEPFCEMIEDTIEKALEKLCSSFCGVCPCF
ncbi:MAG TPA: hypothetical protein HA348_03405 [Thermoplasmata archaeon]|nr:hypothetical protein [Thermoplasmata archaeon]